MSTSRSDLELLRYQMQILQKVLNSLKEIRKVIRVNGNKTACSDPFCDGVQGADRMPGGLILLYHFGYLEDYLSKRNRQKIVVYLHEKCGFLYVVLGLDTANKQLLYVNKFIDELKATAEKFEVEVEIHMIHKGSAPLIEQE